MLLNPSFRLGSGTNGTSAPVPTPPSAYLKLPCGEIVSAWREKESPHGRRGVPPTSAQKAGLSYQRKVERHLTACGRLFVSGPWFCYNDSTASRRYCQPDFILNVGGGRVIVAEAKLRWTVDAWWQLTKLYLPVIIRSGETSLPIPLCITKSFDPSVRAPEEIFLVDSIEDAQPGRFNLLVFR